MPNKIDELFAPERLRRNWQKTKKHADRPIIGETEGKSPLDIFEHLQILIRKHFSGNDVQALNPLLEELSALLLTVFPAEGQNQIPAENPEKSIAAIHEVLNRIEDLVDAFEIAGRGR